MHPQSMFPRAIAISEAPFLPLAFRFIASFGLVVVHLALPMDPNKPPVGETFYLACLVLIFLESAWEAARSLARAGQPFAIPSLSWIRFN
ncbi:MAG: hypothetical protein Q8O00_06760, partial [Holophaga sp.]|nr:hypothetical protein [Holophaga sp.]